MRQRAEAYFLRTNRIGVRAALIVATLLLLTNPDEGQFTAWAQTDSARTVSARQAGEAPLVTAGGIALLPALLQAFCYRENFYLFSLFRAKADGRPIALGIGGHFARLSDPCPDGPPADTPAAPFR